MRRSLLATVMMVLAFSTTGCGRVGPVSGAASTGSNRAKANFDAEHLLTMVHLPPGSSLASTPRSSGFEQPPDFIGVSASATASRTWTVHAAARQALQYVVAHLHPGSKLQSTGSGNGDESQIRSWPPVKGVLDGRWLQLQAYSHAGHTYLKARSQSEWVIARDSSERIPPEVRKITITVRNSHGLTVHQLTIADPRTVRDVVRLYNSLGVIQPATIMGCPGEPAGTLAVKFYNSSTDEIASANSPADADPPWPTSAAAWACFPIKITLAQHSAPSLSGNVITPLAKLLNTRLNS